MSKRKDKSKQATTRPAPVTVSAEQRETDWWSRGFAIAALAISIPSIGVSVYTARWGSAYFYAAPNALSYAYTQSNVVKGDDPASSNTTVGVYNSGATPARNIRILARPITADAVIKCDQAHTVQKAPWGAVVIDIDRIPAKGSAKITVFEETEKFPPSFEPWTGLKYQYSAKVDGVETEFGSVRCDYNRCAVFFRPSSDDTDEPYVRHPNGLTLEDLGKEPYPDATLVEVPKEQLKVYDKRPMPVSPPPRH